MHPENEQSTSSSLGVLRNDSTNDVGLTGVGLLAAVATQDEQLHSEGVDFRLSPIALSDYRDKQYQQSDFSDEYDSPMDEEDT